ncbi:MAG: pyrroline-5-carboxylate reductase [Porticoccaceae bacterium]|jgi:pyrroline-5-carboxylate reductase|nr:pyrroline-5-carboxylate reductase [Porticoccaceae bacterium]MBT5577947.1 pyrroline-5-carboxylate reductase [Porticoccaceae bacterium]MBT7376097.1 pyrroline-5-carboxylate reductase [Porticoccaceae bacterium]
MSSIAFIGGGNMASCIIGGMITNGFSPDQILVGTPSAGTRQKLESTYGVTTFADNHAAAASADLVVLAVKPQMMHAVVADLAPALGHRPIVISVAAGVPVAALSNWLAEGMSIVRAMPNTPSMLESGATGLFTNQTLSDANQQLVNSIFQAVGYTCWVDDEALIDAVIAVSGSGPAYFYLVMEIMQKIGEELGLPSKTAQELCQQTALGAARMATETGIPPCQLRAQVTSPGGTTHAAISCFQEQGLEAIFRQAMNSAVGRAQEMSKDYSS